jgi:hypothetical protein
MAHACNPSYAAGRDQEDCSSKSAGEIVRETLSQKPITTKGWWTGSMCRPWVQAPLLQKQIYTSNVKT